MRSYKAAPTNVKKNHVAGSFKHDSRNKPGKKSLNKNESAKNREEGVHAKLKKISKALFYKKSNTSMHAQTNA